MHVPKIDVRPTSLAVLLQDMEAGRLQVPRFQRDFVWPLSKTRALLDSIYKEFPIGTLFLWHAPTDAPHLFRSLADIGIPEPAPHTPLSYVLDGQQRLISLYAVVSGLKIGSRDYGRVCLDLRTATTYDATDDDGFDEDIFVYRTGDNERYVAVRDLVGEEHLSVYDQVPQDLRAAFAKARALLTATYPLSVVWIQEQRLGDAIEIFQRINQAGKRLSRYDLVCANVWTKEFDFRRRVALLNREFAQGGFGELDETIYTQVFALISKGRCTTAAELSLETQEIIEQWDRVVRSVRLAVEFARNNLGVRRVDFLPYRGILVVLAYYFYVAPSSALSTTERKTLWDWFWRVTLSERYSSTSPSRMVEDTQALLRLTEGENVSFSFASRVTPEAVRRTKMSSTSSALRNAFLCLLSLRQPLNLKNNSQVNLADSFFSNLKKSERHHIFPVGYLKAHGWPIESVHLLPNFCFLPADLNREITDRNPSDYLAAYKAANPRFSEAAESHLLPVGPEAAVWRDDYEKFLEERSLVIAGALNNLTESGPEASVRRMRPHDLLASKLDALEVHIRDFIDHRLSSVMGQHYWKSAVPGDVQAEVKKRITDYVSRHPWEPEAQIASGRRRLDFCDFSHYEKIILVNWPQFSALIQRKAEFQRYMADCRNLRNCVRHNREPSDIEQQSGNTAMLWLDRVLDAYDESVTKEELTDEAVLV